MVVLEGFVPCGSHKARRVESRPVVLQPDIVEDAAIAYFSKSHFEDEIGDSGRPTQHVIL